MRQVLTLVWLVQWLVFLHKVIPHSTGFVSRTTSIAFENEDKSVDVSIHSRHTASLIKSNPNSIQHDLITRR